MTVIDRLSELRSMLFNSRVVVKRTTGVLLLLSYSEELEWREITRQSL
jgi:hypothetical protein